MVSNAASRSIALGWLSGLRILSHPPATEPRWNPDGHDGHVARDDVVLMRQFESVDLDGDDVVFPDRAVTRIDLAAPLAGIDGRLALIKVRDFAVVVDAAAPPLVRTTRTISIQQPPSS
jgi:hypothetical protein